MGMIHRAEGFSGQRIVILPRQVAVSALRHGLLRHLLPTDAGYFPKAGGHFMERAVGVDQAVFIYCIKGQGWCEIGGSRQNINPGEVLVIPPGTPHAYGADDQRPWTISWIHAKGESVLPLISALEVTPARPILYLGEDPQLLALFEELLSVMERGYAASHLLYASQILNHFIGLMIWHRHRNWKGDLDPIQKVEQSIAYMKQHLGEESTVASFAALANLSESHFRSLFKRKTGYAPKDYLIRLRMHKACQLLDTTNLSVKEIAMMVGYQDALYFSRIFSAVMETAPTQYRLVHKG